MDFLKKFHHDHDDDHHKDHHKDVPSSGFRIKLSTDSPLPRQELERAGRAPFSDLDHSPVYVGSAIIMHNDGQTPKSVQPGKISPHLHPACMIPFGGREIGHHGRYDVLIMEDGAMEWVRTSHGRIPDGHTPVEGGYEENHDKLYHAAARVDNIMVPGKTGHHLGAAHVSFGGQEHVIHENYEILYVLYSTSINIVRSQMNYADGFRSAAGGTASIESWRNLCCKLRVSAPYPKCSCHTNLVDASYCV
ncbi:hypothetical protein C8R43DRAFT_986572 [Mycena crocata]|nr:hypothetical protein C8R43DRAFT_986572 [Mycena crocata]